MVGNAGTRLLLIIGNQATFISEYMFEDSEAKLVAKWEESSSHSGTLLAAHL